MTNSKFKCPKCERVFEQDNPWFHESPLRHLYHDEKLSLSQIGSVFDRSDATIFHWMDKHEIDRRSVSESLRHVPLRVTTSDNGYERINVGVNGDSSASVGIHRLVAIAHHGYEAVKNKDVHHKNGIPWDNRPENLKPMSAKKHQQMHFEENREMLARTSRKANAKLSKEQVREIKCLLEKGVSQYEIADEYAVSQTTISKINRGMRWGDVSV